MDELKRPKVGAAVFVFNDEGKVLLGKRLGKHSYGKWGLPGGHLENGESIFESAARELMEETNLEVARNLDGSLQMWYHPIVPFSQEYYAESGLHYVTFNLRCRIVDLDALNNNEPDKHESWEWFDSNDFPENIWRNIDHIYQSEYEGQSVKINTRDLFQIR